MVTRLQTKLPDLRWSQQWKFGGSLLKGHARGKRPLSPRLPLHLVLRSSRAKGSHSLLRHKREIDTMTQRLAAQHHVRVHAQANVGNHLHLLIKPFSRAAYCAFIRALTGRVARIVLRAERGRPHFAANGTEKFWDSLPFTRAISWGRELRALIRYMAINRIEAQGLDRINARLLLAQIADAGFT